MKVIRCESKGELGRLAAERGARKIRRAISERGRADIALATGTSQFEMLDYLTVEQDLEWSLVNAFHLDEYIGLGSDHPASFARYIRERFGDKTASVIHYINGEADPAAECARLRDILRARKLDLAFVGIGENGHLAFNDPPADFESEVPYKVVDLAESSRRQQVEEGWFQTSEEVPGQAISMTIRQIMKANAVICCCPDERKAKAVKAAVAGPVTPYSPASMLQRHAKAFIYLDPGSASLL